MMFGSMKLFPKRRSLKLILERMNLFISIRQIQLWWLDSPKFHVDLPVPDQFLEKLETTTPG